MRSCLRLRPPKANRNECTSGLNKTLGGILKAAGPSVKYNRGEAPRQPRSNFKARVAEWSNANACKAFPGLVSQVRILPLAFLGVAQRQCSAL